MNNKVLDSKSSAHPINNSPLRLFPKEPHSVNYTKHFSIKNYKNTNNESFLKYHKSPTCKFTKIPSKFEKFIFLLELFGIIFSILVFSILGGTLILEYIPFMIILYGIVVIGISTWVLEKFWKKSNAITQYVLENMLGRHKNFVNKFQSHFKGETLGISLLYVIIILGILGIVNTFETTPLEKQVSEYAIIFLSSIMTINIIIMPLAEIYNKKKIKAIFFAMFILLMIFFYVYFRYAEIIFV